MSSKAHTKTVLITGCSDHGIGSALALAFQQRGHTVFAGVRNPQKAASLSSLPNVTIVTLDVTSPSSITAAVEIVRQHTGETLDVLINNAGQSVSTPLLDADLNTGRQLFEVNFWGALALVQAFGPMLVRAKGVVVNISSLGAVVNTPYLGLYGSSKAALTIASETLRLEMRPLGVKTVTVMTGMVRTEFHDNIPAVVLPEGSFYRSVEERVRATTTVEGEMVKWQMPAEKFAEEIVNHVLNGVEGYVYKGGMSAVLRWCKWILPGWVLVIISSILQLQN
jgi:NAD(P)-dependent dehydrogenase (short-subunit alcohol dehydrogenase family)